jgi:hypothetical protein
MVLSVNSKDPEETTRWLFPGNLVCPNHCPIFRRLKALHQGLHFHYSLQLQFHISC